jgi:beta-phosphoglucomutase
MIKLVIFDFDGVVADSHSGVNDLFSNLINTELNLKIKPTDFAKYPGMRFEQRLSIIAKENNLDINWERITKIISKGRETYYKQSQNMTKLYPETIKFIKQLRENNIKVALGSNGSKNVILKLLDQFNATKYFDNIVTFDDVDNGKPHPEMFLKSMDKFNFSPSECVVIGDASQDIDAAQNGKMYSIALLTTDSKEILKNADIILDHPRDLNLKLLEQLK